MAARAPPAPAPAPPRPDARPPQPQPRRARAEDYDEFVAFTGVDRATAERFVGAAALGHGLSLRDAIRAFFEGQELAEAAAAAAPRGLVPDERRPDRRGRPRRRRHGGERRRGAAGARGEALRQRAEAHPAREPREYSGTTRSAGAAGVRPKDKLWSSS